MTTTTTLDPVLFAKAIADDTRQQIMKLTCCRWRSVTEIVEQLDVTQPTVSHHLAILREAGLVNFKEDGKQTYYRLNRDLMTVCRILEGCRVAPGVHFHVNPGSRQALENVAQDGGVLMLLMAGVSIHQSGCLGCIGMGQAPGTDQVSLRTFPRNFPGRSGTKGDKVYLCSPETAAASGSYGVITDPRRLGEIRSYPAVQNPEKYLLDDSGIIFPLDDGSAVEIKTGPNILPFPDFEALPDTLLARVVIKLGDNKQKRYYFN